MRRVCALMFATNIVLIAAMALPVAAASQGLARSGVDPDPVYHPPTDAPIVDPFRPPAHVGGAGNRGLEYATSPGTSIRASAAGQVSFAGEVAGSLHVTVSHRDGLRTSYSYLSRIDVVTGQFVVGGQLLGRSGTSFHFGVREGDRYLDPAGLLASEPRRSRLVPTGEGRPTAPLGPAPGGAARAWAQALPAAGPVAASPWKAALRSVAKLALHFRSG